MTLYKMKEFAALAGVTVKALRYYERLGLIKPRRTGAGHRRYEQTDLGRLEAIPRSGIWALRSTRSG